MTQTFITGNLVFINPRDMDEVEELLIKHSADETPQQEVDSLIQTFERQIHVSFEDNIAALNCKRPCFRLDESEQHALRQYREAQLKDPVYQEMFAKRLGLPALQHRDDILHLVAQNQVVVIAGNTGCGKSTQIPQMLLDNYLDNLGDHPYGIICTQPRRLCTVSLAERVAEERHEPLGQSVGYEIRLDHVIAKLSTSVTYCTTGTLLQKLQSDPLMRSISVLIIDEVHERSIETDLLLALIKKTLPHRNDMRVVLMSATVREADFQQYFNGCALYRIEGRQHAVRELFLEDVLQEMNYKRYVRLSRKYEVSAKKYEAERISKRPATNSPSASHTTPQRKRFQYRPNYRYLRMIRPYIRRINDSRYSKAVIESLRVPESEGCRDMLFIVNVIEHICRRKPQGAILVFVPGMRDIKKLSETLRGEGKFRLCHLKKHKLLIYELHSALDTLDQKKIFEKPPEGYRKVIISTSLAETSVTIDDVNYVVNTGKMNIQQYDVDSRLVRLKEVWNTKANCEQRKGRAGRVQPGVCYNLFTRARYESMFATPKPSILDARLQSIVLWLKGMHIDDVDEFLQTLLTPPRTREIRNSVELLKNIGALDKNGRLTALGSLLAKLSVDPQLGKMLLMSSLFSCIDPISSIAAGMSHRSPFIEHLGDRNELLQNRRALANQTCSDLLLMHRCIEKYRLCTESDTLEDLAALSLNANRIDELERLKQQLTSELFANKFSTTDSCKHIEANQNSEDGHLLRAIIAYGLSPNIVHLTRVKKDGGKQHKSRSKKTITRLTALGGKQVHFHRLSVLNRQENFTSNFFMYFVVRQMSKVYLMDSTMVNSMDLLLFCDDVAENLAVFNGKLHMILGNTYSFEVNERLANIILKVRKLFRQLLLRKVICPEPITATSVDKYLISAIKLLISSFAFTRYGPPDSDDSD